MCWNGANLVQRQVVYQNLLTKCFLTQFISKCEKQSTILVHKSHKFSLKAAGRERDGGGNVVPNFGSQRICVLYFFARRTLNRVIREKNDNSPVVAYFGLSARIFRRHLNIGLHTSAKFRRFITFMSPWSESNSFGLFNFLARNENDGIRNRPAQTHKHFVAKSLRSCTILYMRRPIWLFFSCRHCGKSDAFYDVVRHNITWIVHVLWLLWILHRQHSVYTSMRWWRWHTRCSKNVTAKTGYIKRPIKAH